MTLRECADMIGVRRQRVPRRAYTRFVAAMWRLGGAVMCRDSAAGDRRPYRDDVALVEMP